MARSFTAASSQCLDLGTASGLQITGDISVSCLIKTSAASGGQGIITCYNLSSPFTGWGMMLNGTGTAVGKLCYWSNGNGSWRVSTNALNSGAWRHAGFTISGTGASAGTFYLDGASNGTFTQTSPGSWTGVKYLGRTGDYFQGELAEIAIWNTALSSAEMASLGKWYSPDQIRPGSLVSYWPLIGRSNPEPDLFSGHNGTLTNAPPQFAHPRIIYPRAPQLFAPSAAAPATTILPFVNHYMAG